MPSMNASLRPTRSATNPDAKRAMASMPTDTLEPMEPASHFVMAKAAITPGRMYPVRLVSKPSQRCPATTVE